MAIIGYDPEKEEVSNDQKIKNCFTLSIFMLLKKSRSTRKENLKKQAIRVLWIAC